MQPHKIVSREEWNEARKEHLKNEKALTRMGYEATDATRQAVISGLDALADATEGSVVQRMEKARNSVLYEMNAAVAKQVLRSMKGK